VSFLTHSFFDPFLFYKLSNVTTDHSLFPSLWHVASGMGLSFPFPLFLCSLHPGKYIFLCLFLITLGERSCFLTRRNGLSQVRRIYFSEWKHPSAVVCFRSGFKRCFQLNFPPILQCICSLDQYSFVFFFCLL